MSWRVFLAVVAVALVNVAVGLDWLSTPQAPPRVSSLQVPIAYPTPPSSPPAAAAPITPALAPAQAAAPRATPAVSAAAVPTPGPEASEARAQAPSAPSAPPGCNVSACEGHYKSFRISDCTYQPNDGPRKLCRRK